VHSGKKTHKSDLRRSSPEQFSDEIFLLERTCDDQNMAAELPESCSFGNCYFGFQPSLFLTLLLGVVGGGKCSCLASGVDAVAATV
jgi:hypothetical protein